MKHIGCTNELREEKGELVLTGRSHNEQEDCTIGGRQRETKTSIEDRKLVSSELLAAKDRSSSNDEGMK